MKHKMRLVYTVVREFQANSVGEEIRGFNDNVAPNVRDCLYNVGYGHWDSGVSVKMEVNINDKWDEVASSK